jgi:hypothetical protein
MKKLIVLTTVLFMISASALMAQRQTATNTGRQINQQARIHQGARSGELTGREAVALEREQKKIQIEKRIAKADGTVTPAEKRFLRREQNRASRHIARQKNDAQDRR